MFCSQSDKIQSIVERSKLLAQKCSQQVEKRSNAERKNRSPSIVDDLSRKDDELEIRHRSVPCFKNPINRLLDNYARATLPLRSTNSRRSNSIWYIKQPTWRLWGEEREQDAIFTVYLKKVRYHRPTLSTNSSQESDDDISHLEWETVRVRFVKAASLNRLVEALATDDGELESTFVNVFLATYRTFAKTEIVLDLLLRRYDDLNEEPLRSEFSDQHKKTLVSVLHVWLDGYSEDWNSQNLHKLLTFTSKWIPNSELHMKALSRLDRLERYLKASLPWEVDYTDFVEHFENGMCLGSVLQPPVHLLQAYRFPYIPIKHFAEQLTRMDMDLFKRVIPHQCLGAIWSGKEKRGASSVTATVNQFNAVLFRVISSILIEPRLKPPERATIISTWVDIAQELRILKNFSSLKAIISGLQSSSIYRLTKTWTALSKEKMETYNELARIFSAENNAWVQREVLMREGTAKFADTVGENDRHLQKILQNQNTHISHGTIPYLGTFLTDLTMIHTAIPDCVGENNLINFDKRRKEFEILAQIKLLQGAANTYQLPEDHLFDHWFASLLVLDDRESHALSCQLEPPEPKKPNYLGHKKNNSITSNSSSGAGSQFYYEVANTSDPNSRNNSLDRNTTPPNASIMSMTSSISSVSAESSSSGPKSNGKSHHGKNNTKGTDDVPIINPQLVQPSTNKNQAPDFYIIQVTYETDNIELDGIVLYKCIMLGNNERTPQVIRNAMMKLGLEGDPDKWTLSQVLPDKELMMPTNANVYYAVNTAFNLKFILRPKKSK